MGVEVVGPVRGGIVMTAVEAIRLIRAGTAVGPVDRVSQPYKACSGSSARFGAMWSSVVLAGGGRPARMAYIRSPMEVFGDDRHQMRRQR